MIISLDAEKSLCQNTTPWMLKELEISGIQGPYLCIIKAIYSIPIANIKINGETLKPVPLKPGTRKTDYSPYIYSIDYLKFYPEQLDNKRRSKGNK